MEFRVERRPPKNMHKYASEDLALARKFADGLQKELHDFVMGVVVFGSIAREEGKAHSDIDVLVITDDSTYVIDDALVEGYRLIVENLMHKITNRFHVTSMTFTTFFEHVMNGDPVVVNILRDGVHLYDRGFFDPLQRLLQVGKIRPSEESIWRYFGRAPKTLLNSRWHVLQATLDLYWSVIDAAHSALMRANQIPPTPEHVADMLEKVYVRKKLLDKKHVATMRKFYTLSKNITHRKVEEVGGVEYEKLYREADTFVQVMRRLVEKGRF